MSFQGRVRTFYRHEASARKGEQWAADMVDKLLEEAASGATKLPELGSGYSKIYRAAYRVRSIAEGKLRMALPAHEKVFWMSVADEASAILSDVTPG
jgi:hypothetical protein